ncbi:hypothetical protein GGR33_000456 [Methylobacterium brachythecii]|uniref:Uncharacterized protein n=1 Tax=Methylobacterium brachythecii TaxID=1176177 RepID=A0A7W6AHA3_9HYPH|nr:hypothetical protein [Methylobacterium brachythecii]
MTEMVVSILCAAGLGIVAGASFWLTRIVLRSRRREKPADQERGSRDLRTW